MSALKRKSSETYSERRVAARREPTPEEESQSSSSSNEDPELVHENSGDGESSDEADDSEMGGPEEAAQRSFGALAKARAIGESGRTKPSAKLSKHDGDTWENNEAVERKAGRKDRRDFNRSSKHAPTEISSKKAVSRKREVVSVAQRRFRDPRFENMDGPVDDLKIRRNYAFLDEYVDDEIKELKDTIKVTRDDDARERLKKALLSKESKRKAQMRKDKRDEIIDKHKKEEKELVKQGKQPFFLKQKEVEKRVLLDQYGGLKGKQLDRVIERRRKKVEGKEKKKMPFARRGMES